MSIIKVTITGYIDVNDDSVLSNLNRIVYEMHEGAGICTGIDDEKIEYNTLEDLPDEIQDFFQYMFDGGYK